MPCLACRYRFVFQGRGIWFSQRARSTHASAGYEIGNVQKNRQPRDESSVKAEQPRKIISWAKSGDLVYGSFLNFRGLQHSPLNEQGVVFLFGMICLELGFVVEAIRDGYPGCEAKRRIDRHRDQWERVRIEFEYRSSGFKDHGHNPKGCDLIVCWIHDWTECPFEVVELRSAIETLPEWITCNVSKGDSSQDICLAFRSEIDFSNWGAASSKVLPLLILLHNRQLVRRFDLSWPPPIDWGT